MIMPTKHIPVSYTYLGIGAEILKNLKSPCRMEDLWVKFCRKPQVGSFERFMLSLDLLYMLDLIFFHQGMLHRRVN